MAEKFTIYGEKIMWGGACYGTLHYESEYWWFVPNNDLGYDLKISSYQLGLIQKILDVYNGD